MSKYLTIVQNIGLNKAKIAPKIHINTAWFEALRALLIASPLIAISATADEKPFRLETAMQTPDWLSISGETRGRYESLDGQFRAGGKGGDQLLSFRSLLKIEADAGPLSFGTEIQDSRAYLSDKDSPLSTGFVNPLDILQAYARFEHAPNIFGWGGDQEAAQLTLGRQTISIGSKRQIERTSFSNVIRSYTGAYYTAKNDRKDEFHAFYVVPVAVLPRRRKHLEDNDMSADEEQWERRLWGVHYRRADILPQLAPRLWGEIYAYGLNESDTKKFATPNRDYITPGFRLYRKPAPQAWDVDIEGAYRFGERRAFSASADKIDLDVKATMLLARLGYTFDQPWQPRIAVQYYHTSGDDDPTDGDFDQYEQLFGGRRTDLNNTSIHGPLRPTNLNHIGLRFNITPSKRWDARLHYGYNRLASRTDRFVSARLWDLTGNSGKFLGHTLDSRFRYQLVPGNLTLETGASVFFHGKFTKNAPAAPDDDTTLFGYSQLTFKF